jgi:hypothetical protein
MIWTARSTRVIGLSTFNSSKYLDAVFTPAGGAH